jgi:tricorn protease
MERCPVLRGESDSHSLAVSHRQRAVFEARGEIITVPAEKGDPRNITITTGVHERSPAWSPDGKWIAYWSDEKGEYNLYLKNQNGFGEPRVIRMEERAYFFQLQWSPGSKKLAVTDNKLNLWVVDVEKNTQKKIDTDTYYEPLPLQRMNPVWAPDSRWLAYTKLLKNRLRAVFIHWLERGRSEQITDGLSDARNAQFDRSGQYLYFAASTDTGLAPHWLDMSSQLGRPTRTIYPVVLRNDLPSPFAPESDEEKAVEEEKKKEEDKPATQAAAEVRIDFDNIGQRVLALPVPARNYTDVIAGKEGVVYLVESTGPIGPAGSDTVHRFDIKSRKTEKLAEGANLFTLSANGEKMLFRQGDKYVIAKAEAAPKAGEGLVKTDSLEIRVDPRAEWKQMYDEVCRIQRDWLYDSNYHGLDLVAQARKYEPWLARVASRADLNYLFEEMLGAITVGHLYVRGGEMPEVTGPKVGLLGADYEAVNGRYRFARVFNGENWNPELKAPLTQPGVNVVAGEYLLAVNGVEVDTSRDVHSWLEAAAGKQTVLRVGSDPAGTNAREVTVIPVESEAGLRMLGWVEDNRRKVAQMTNGRIAYVYLPDTAGGGFNFFNRYYFSQVDREGAVIDERFNGGGQAADYIIDFLNRPLMNLWSTRYGQDFTTPRAIFGPKVMIINEAAGSGGDLMPWYFRRMKIAPLIGHLRHGDAARGYRRVLVVAQVRRSRRSGLTRV